VTYCSVGLFCRKFTDNGGEKNRTFLCQGHDRSHQAIMTCASMPGITAYVCHLAGRIGSRMLTVTRLSTVSADYKRRW